jgi:predicted O-methyltransferase YrrM
VRLSRVLLLSCFALGVAAIVALLLSADRPAVGLLTAALLALAAWLSVRLRVLGQQLTAVDRRTRGLRRSQRRSQDALLREVRALRGELAQVPPLIAEVADTQHRVHRADVIAFRGVTSRLDAQRTYQHKLPSVTVELGRAYDRLAPADFRMPELGGWAMAPGALLDLLDLVTAPACTTVFECGSGSSTVWFAAAMERRGGEGRIVSLDSDVRFGQQTRDRLEAAGLAHRATVLDAPLADRVVGDRPARPWYTLPVLDDDLRIDLLLVDGPVGALASEVRYPAWPLLADRMRPGGIVVLDDTIRADEKNIVEAWTTEVHHGLRLRVDRQLEQATVMVVEQA